MDKGTDNPAFDMDNNNNDVQLTCYGNLRDTSTFEKKQVILQLPEVNRNFHDHSSNRKDTVTSDSNNNEGKFTIFWRELSMRVNEREWSFNWCPKVVSREKTILQSCSGLITEASMTAIMGPSGSGKTTLLRCLLNSEDIQICMPDRNRKNFKMSFIPQDDFHFEEFTVRETLLFSSKVRNRNTDHASEVSRVITELNLTSCEKTRMKSCSGGQRRRVSIAQELLSRPDIMLLDEPISGLDSTNANMLIDLLKGLTVAGRTTVLASVHQPSASVFNSFDQIYLLSNEGKNIYAGPPTEVPGFLRSLNIKKGNASDSEWMLEIASGNLPSSTNELMEEMTQVQRNKPLPLNCQENDIVPLQSLLTMRRDPGVSSVKQLSLLAARSLKSHCFESWQFLFKFLLNIVMALMVVHLWTEPLGSENGCWSDQRSNSTAQYLRTISRVTGNCNYLYAITTYVLIVFSIASVLVIPFEFNTVHKELANKWYHPFTYFISKLLVDLPITLVTSVPMLWLGYYLTEQIPDYWRFLLYVGVYFFYCYACESLGALIGVIFSNDLAIAVLLTMCLTFPIIMFAGFLVKLSDISWYFSPGKYTSFQGFAFQSVLVIVYGFDRCQDGNITALSRKRLGELTNPREIMKYVYNSFNVTRELLERYAVLIDVSYTDQLEPVINGTVDYFSLEEPALDDEAEGKLNPSYVLSYFEVEDGIQSIITNLMCLLMSIIILRSLLYLTIYAKTKKYKM